MGYLQKGIVRFASFILQSPRCMQALTPTGQAKVESFSAHSNRRLTLGIMNEHNVIYNAYRGEEWRSVKVK